MATLDLSGTSGGQRPSRGRRSSAPNIRTEQGPTVRHSGPKRPSRANIDANSGTQDLAQVTAALGNFFSDALGVVHQEELREIEKENEEEVTRITNEVSNNRDAAKEAVATGDWSKFFSPNSATKDRRIIQNTFYGLVGQVSAIDDAKIVREGILGMDFTGDPDDLVESFTREQTKGGNAFFTRAYQKKMAQIVDKDIAEWKKARVEFHQSQAKERTKALIVTNLDEGLYEANERGLEALTKDTVGGLMPFGPQAGAEGLTLRDKVIMDMALRGNPTAIKLMAVPEKGRDGLSLAVREKEAYAKALTAHRRRVTSIGSAKAHEALGSIEERYRRINEGRPDEGDTMGRVTADLYAWGEQHTVRGNEPSEYKALRDKILTLTKGSAEVRAAVSRVMAGGHPRSSNKTWNKAAKQLWGELGTDDNTKNVRVMRALALNGSGKDMKETNSSLLKTGQPREVEQTFRTLVSLYNISPNKDMSGHLDDDSRTIFHAMRWADRTGKPVSGFLEKVRENLGRANEEGLTPHRYLEQTTIKSGINRKAIGRPGVMKMGEKVWSAIEDDDRLGGKGFDLGWSSVGAQARNVFVKALNLAALYQSHLPYSEDAVVSMAAELVKGDLALGLENGKQVVVINNMPKMTLGPDGKPAPTRTPDEDDLERVSTAIKDTPGFGAFFIDEKMNLLPDKWTSMGGGFTVQSYSQSGFAEDVVLPPGKTFKVDTDNADNEMLNALFNKEEGGFKVPVAPKDGDPTRRDVTDQLFLLWNPNRGWMLRAYMGPRKGTVAELGAAHEANKANLDDGGVWFRRKGVEYRKPPAMGRGATLGGPVPADNESGPMDDDDHEELEDMWSEMVDDMESRGMVKPQTTSQASKEFQRDGAPLSYEERVRRLADIEKENGGWLDDMTMPRSERFNALVAQTIEDSEGRSSTVYDDHTGGKWSAKSKGDPTIGIGFNLRRPDAPTLLAKVGADYGAVLSGQQGLTRLQQDKLLELGMQETTNWLKKHFKGVSMSNHQWASLISLAYNSRWNDSGPTLIGPKITKAIKSGDWKAAENEIRNNSSGGVPKSLLAGIQARREREADLFAGYLTPTIDDVEREEMEAEIASNETPPASPNNDWLDKAISAINPIGKANAAELNPGGIGNPKNEDWPKLKGWLSDAWNTLADNAELATAAVSQKVVSGLTPTDSSEVLISDWILKNKMGIPVNRVTLTESDLKIRNLKALRDLVLPIVKAGKRNLTWKDYGTDALGNPVSGIVGGSGVSGADKTYPRTPMGALKLGAMTMLDPKVDLALTIGQATISVDEEGNIILTDQYDAEKFLKGSRSQGAYGAARNFLGDGTRLTTEGGKNSPIKWRINLGKV